MQKNLNIKTLAKGMRVEDKAKLLFADRNKRAETNGEEGLLTPDEERALIEDAQDLHQINELNRLNRLFNMATYVMLDVQTAYLHFQIAQERLSMILVGMILVGEGSDALDQTIYDLSPSVSNKKARKYRNKYKKRSLTKIFDYFELTDLEDNKSLSQPNPLLQRAFMNVICEIKKFRKQTYSVEYIEEKAGMVLLGENDKRTINSFIAEIDQFIKLDGYLGLIKMYVDFADKGILRYRELAEPKFLEFVRNLEKVARMTEKEKRVAGEEIEKIIWRK